MDAFDSLDSTSGQLEEHVISTPPNDDLPVDGQAESDGSFPPCIIA